jgi:hypothetical protein
MLSKYFGCCQLGMCQDKYNVEIDVSNDRVSYINDVDDEDLEDF